MPIGPEPNTASDSGSVVHSKTSSLTTTRSRTASNAEGTDGDEPVAMTTARASIDWPSTPSRWGVMKRAQPWIRSPAGMLFAAAADRSTNRSRSRRRRSITARPSTRKEQSIPNPAACFAVWAISAAASRSLLGMHPTRAHVVPGGPCSMTTTRAVRAMAAWYAARPAVPEPKIATSTERCGAGSVMGSRWPASNTRAARRSIPERCSAKAACVCDAARIMQPRPTSLLPCRHWHRANARQSFRSKWTLASRTEETP